MKRKNRMERGDIVYVDMGDGIYECKYLREGVVWLNGVELDVEEGEMIRSGEVGVCGMIRTLGYLRRKKNR